MNAASSAVAPPVIATYTCTDGTCTNSGEQRASRYTPAVTIVAAWMRADTGVGPSIASGSHTYSGSWADLPTAPQNSSSAMSVAVSVAGGWAVRCSIRAVMSVL